MEKTYMFPFCGTQTVDGPQEAFSLLTHFCNLCSKDAVEQFHCSGADAAKCEAVKEQVRKDWFYKKND